MKNYKEIESILKESTTYLADELDLYALTEDSFADANTLRDDITDYIYQSVEVIYYPSAMEFLFENDPSLRESMELAQEFCTELSNINSEYLATILLQSYCLNEVEDFIEALEEAELIEA